MASSAGGQVEALRMKSQIYQPQEDVFFDDGREIQLLHYIYGRPDIESLRNSPERVIAAIDEYARREKYLMNVGEEKGRIVSDLIKQQRPKTMVELGGYIGYSCLLFATAMRAATGSQARYFSLERNPEFAAVISSLVALAGLQDTVTVVVGASDASIRRLARDGVLQSIDFMFLDHYKPAYTTDLKLCEELRLVKPGTMLAADNVIKPGNPPYLEYVRSSVREKRAAAENLDKDPSGIKGTDGVDSRFQDRTKDQYKSREGDAKLDTALKGNPNLVYESRLVHSFEPSGVPDGVEITECLREDR